MMDWLRFSNPIKPSSKLYFGSRSPNKLHLDENGILWLTPSRTVAANYATPYYWGNRPSWIWTIHLKPGTRLISINDVNVPAVEELRQQLNEFFFLATGPVSVEEWVASATSSYLEGKPWIAQFFLERDVQGVVTTDVLGTSSVPHVSIALFDMIAIEKATRRQAPRYQERTFGELQKLIEADERRAGWR